MKSHNFICKFTFQQVYNQIEQRNLTLYPCFTGVQTINFKVTFNLILALKQNCCHTKVLYDATAFGKLVIWWNVAWKNINKNTWNTINHLKLYKIFFSATTEIIKGYNNYSYSWIQNNWIRVFFNSFEITKKAIIHNRKMAAPAACRGSGFREGTCAIVVTWATAVPMPDP